MQFSAIRTYAATRFRDPSNIIVTDTQWKDYVNTAYGDVLTRLPYAPWNEASATVALSAASRTGALPTDVFKVTAVYDATDQFPLVPLEGRNQVFQEYPQQTETGQPMHYRLLGGNILVYPIPEAATNLTVEYLKMPADMSADADVPAFPSQWHDALVSGAVALAYRDDGNMQMAAEYEKESQGMIASLIQDSMQPRQDRYYEIVDTAF
jgi:hypothetical protein